MFGAEIVGSFRSFATAAVSDLVPQDDKLWQVVVQRTETIVRPGSDRGEESIETVSSRVKLKLSVVIAGRRPHRANDRHVVNALGKVRQPIADLDTAFAVFAITDL